MSLLLPSSPPTLSINTSLVKSLYKSALAWPFFTEDELMDTLRPAPHKPFPANRIATGISRGLKSHHSLLHDHDDLWETFIGPEALHQLGVA